MDSWQDPPSPTLPRIVLFLCFFLSFCVFGFAKCLFEFLSFCLNVLRQSVLFLSRSISKQLNLSLTQSDLFFLFTIESV